MEGLAARAVRELLANGMLRPAGSIRDGAETIPLHALPASKHVYDLRAILGHDAAAPAPAKQERGQFDPRGSLDGAGTARSSLAGMRALLRKDWVAFGAEGSLQGLVEELRRQTQDPTLRLSIWSDRLGMPLQPGEFWTLRDGTSAADSNLLDGLSACGRGAYLHAGRAWFAVWSQQRIVGALEVAPDLEEGVSSEAAGVVGDLLHAFLRSQERVFADALTGVNNRAHFEHQFPVELERSRRANQPMALLFADIDFFKKVNDSYGHDVGDLVLQHVARSFVTHLRRIDYVFRWGGEEFALLLPGTDGDEALSTADRLRSVVERSPVTLSDGREVAVTLSIGIALFPFSSTSESELLRCADQALFRAKDEGRNRVVMWSGGAPPATGLLD